LVTPTGAVPLEPYNGWVACDTNDVGIVGAFFPYSDNGGSSISPSSFENAGSEICVTGTAGLVIDGCKPPRAKMFK
jgi:hypothetical protein